MPATSQPCDSSTSSSCQPPEFAPAHGTCKSHREKLFAVYALCCIDSCAAPTSPSMPRCPRSLLGGPHHARC
eukprot:5220865-Heterocapsa_arctica.AAC.1